MGPQAEFLKYLRFKRSLLACKEVLSYGCIADVLAVDKNKKHVLEYEFKNNSQDLKVNEPKKSKYQKYRGVKRFGDNFFSVKGQEVQQPHRFYFVVSDDLWEKEKAYLEKLKVGVIMYTFWEKGNRKGYDFLTMKHCKIRKKNLQKYEVVARDILIRATSAYVNLLVQIDSIRDFYANGKV